MRRHIGLLDVQGSLILGGGGSSTGGTYTVAGSLQLGGTHSYSDANINGAGTLISNGLVTLDSTGTKTPADKWKK